MSSTTHKVLIVVKKGSQSELSWESLAQEGLSTWAKNPITRIRIKKFGFYVGLQPGAGGEQEGVLSK